VKSRIAEDRPEVRPVAAELRLFMVAWRKELFQYWRTGRVIIVLAVFAFFGLSSPLLAYYLPQLIGSIEETAALAEIIPDPTTADALAQYIENVTQFGLIMAVLLGMGSVAAEKAKGTAALILSKPLPRWSFLLSKFATQATIYVLGFLVGAVGAYYYTLVLFDEPLDLLPFLAGNGILLVWLLVFTAVTLCGSTLARSTGAGAGLALVGAAILLLAGVLPLVGGFAPAGLVAWASQLGLSGEVPANGGALTTGVVLILLLLIGSLAAFEQQEL
jgi:ABC-2 type transport system permease protein